MFPINFKTNDFSNSFPGSTGSSATKAPKVEAKKEEKDEDDIDLFGSDDEVDEAAERLKQERLAAYEAKKATSKLSYHDFNLLQLSRKWKCHLVTNPRNLKYGIIINEWSAFVAFEKLLEPANFVLRFGWSWNGFLFFRISHFEGYM